MKGRFSSYRALTLLAVLSFALAAQAAAPNGWLLAGSRPTDYDTGIDAAINHLV